MVGLCMQHTYSCTKVQVRARRLWNVRGTVYDISLYRWHVHRINTIHIHNNWELLWRGPRINQPRLQGATDIVDHWHHLSPTICRGNQTIAFPGTRVNLWRVWGKSSQIRQNKLRFSERLEWQAYKGICESSGLWMREINLRLIQTWWSRCWMGMQNLG